LRSDGVSASIFMTELAAAYNAIKAGRAGPDLAALPIQYADFSAWQRARLDGGELEAQRAHWRQQLADAPLLLQLPTDFARPAEPSGRAGDAGLEVSAEATAGLRALAAGCGATMFTVLLAAWQVRGPRPCPPGRPALGPAAGLTAPRRPGARCCWGGTAGARTWWWARRWPTARGPSWKGCWATSSTPWRCAGTCRVRLAATRHRNTRAAGAPRPQALRTLRDPRACARARRRPQLPRPPAPGEGGGARRAGERGRALPAGRRRRPRAAQLGLQPAVPEPVHAGGRQLRVRARAGRCDRRAGRGAPARQGSRAGLTWLQHCERGAAAAAG